MFDAYNHTVCSLKVILFKPPSEKKSWDLRQKKSLAGEAFFQTIDGLVDWRSPPRSLPQSSHYNSTNNALDSFLLSDRNEI